MSSSTAKKTGATAEKNSKHPSSITAKTSSSGAKSFLLPKPIKIKIPAGWLSKTKQTKLTELIRAIDRSVRAALQCAKACGMDQVDLEKGYPQQLLAYARAEDFYKKSGEPKLAQIWNRFFQEEFYHQYKKKIGYKAGIVQPSRDAAIGMLRSFGSWRKKWFASVKNKAKRLEREQRKGKLTATELEKRFMEWLTKKEQSFPAFPLESVKREQNKEKEKLLSACLDSRIFSLEYRPEKKLTKWWLKLSTLHYGETVFLPLQIYEYARKFIAQAEKLSSVRLTKEGQDFFATFLLKLRISVSQPASPFRAYAGTDFGIKRTAVTSVICEDDWRWKQQNCQMIKAGTGGTGSNNLQQKLNACRRQKKRWQKRLDSPASSPKQKKKARGQLKNHATKVAQLKKQLSRQTANELAEFLLPYAAKYDLRVKLGYPKNIRAIARKGNRKKKQRKLVNDWSFHRDINHSEYNLLERGLAPSQITLVEEKGTSRQCSRCDSFDTERLTQASFTCLTCHRQCNADTNASRNLALKQRPANKQQQQLQQQKPAKAPSSFSASQQKLQGTKKRMRGQQQCNGCKSKYHKSPPSLVNDENARARSPDKVTAKHSLPTIIVQVIRCSGGPGDYLMIPPNLPAKTTTESVAPDTSSPPEGLILTEVAQTKQSAENVQNHSKKLKKKNFFNF